MFERITRNSVHLSFWLAVFLSCLLLNAIVAMANYLGCRTSLEMLGYEGMPLGRDKLIGPFFRAFFGEATISHLYSLGLTLTIELGIFVLLFLAFETFQLFFDRRRSRDTDDEEDAQEASKLIVRNVMLFVIFAVPLVFACRWDIALFRFRSVAAAQGIEDPGIASAIPAWEEQIQQHGHLFPWVAAGIGAWGYIAVTTISSMAIEFSLMKTGECWARLCGCFAELAGPDPDGPDNENRLSGYWAETANDTGTADNTVAHSGQVDAREGFRRQPTVTTTETHQAGPGDKQIDPVSGTDDPAVSRAAPPEDAEKLYEVINRTKGKRVSLAEAIANPGKYWIDNEKDEIWNAKYRKEINGEEEHRK